MVEEGFVAGGSDPADVPAMIFLYRRFGGLYPFARAIAIWAAGDRLVDEIVRLADEVRGDVAPHRDAGARVSDTIVRSRESVARSRRATSRDSKKRTVPEAGLSPFFQRSTGSSLPSQSR